MCGCQIQQLYNNWMEGDIMTILNESNRNVSALNDVPFPGITICSDLQLQNLDNNLTILNQTLDREYEDSINLMCHVYEPNLNIGQHSISSKTWDLLLNAHRIFCKQRVISITWIREKINVPCQYFQPVYTIYGVCYSLNMVPFHQLLNNDYNQVLSNLNHTKADIITNATNTAWDPEIGFNKNAKPFNLPWKVIGDTVEDSVIIRFNLQNENTRKHCPKTDKGMTLFLHSPIDVPANIQPTAYIAVNNIAYITTTFTWLTTSESILGWKPDMRHCYYQHERTLKFFRIYTINNCDIECRANNSLKMCGCVAYYHPRDINTPICGSENYKCMRQYSNDVYSIFDKHLFTINTTNDCNCLNVCTEIRFKHNVVYTHRNLTKKVKNPQKRYPYKSIIVMYYKRNLWGVQRTALIPVNEFLGNIGGSLGLFLGASIISVFELIYFFVIRLYVDRWNKNKVKRNFKKTRKLPLV
ncbi:pickpocket protein 28-like [Metopolophium dirhodum]|uniref:pickpocket protein 28-like n=1 Tax=Metopolophium dirhodum TaxID=44670 RepID=UPI0029906500|nr:pickpocket protein 28-like [Metopolophium dirhodum]XP_060863037.1 pickpocket protein 28-like [Metopolophium dirhodum]